MDWLVQHYIYDILISVKHAIANALEKPAQTAPKNALVHCDFLACFAVLKCVRYNNNIASNRRIGDNYASNDISFPEDHQKE